MKSRVLYVLAVFCLLGLTGCRSEVDKSTIDAAPPPAADAVAPPAPARAKPTPVGSMSAPAGASSTTMAPTSVTPK